MNLTYPFGTPPQGNDVLWRCEEKQYSALFFEASGAESYSTTPLRLEMTWWPVERRTPCGARIPGRFVRLTARKKWACNTEEEALASFIARKRRQLSILGAQIDRARAALALADAW